MKTLKTYKQLFENVFEFEVDELISRQDFDALKDLFIQDTPDLKSQLYLNNIIESVANPLKFIKLFIEYGVDVNETNYYDENSLFVAITTYADSETKEIKDELLEVMKLLIKNDIKINQQNNASDTVLINAVEYNLLPVIKLLIDSGADVNLENKAYHSPLMLAEIDAAKMLIASGANLEFNDRHDNTILSISSTDNDIELIKILIDAGANVNTQNIIFDTPLIKVQEQHKGNRFEIITLLLNAGADMFIKNNSNKTFFDFFTVWDFKWFEEDFPEKYEEYLINQKTDDYDI